MNPYHSFGSKENYPKNYSSKSLPQKNLPDQKIEEPEVLSTTKKSLQYIHI